jgi:hypothetical protein
MKYIKHIFMEIGYAIDNSLRRACGKLSWDARMFIILSMLLLFTIANLYYTVSLVYNWGRNDERNALPEIKHIENQGILNGQEQQCDTTKTKEFYEQE